MSEALRKALKVIDKHSVSAIRTNSKDRGDWAEDMAYVGKVAREALAQPPAPTAPTWTPNSPSDPNICNERSAQACGPVYCGNSGGYCNECPKRKAATTQAPPCKGMNCGCTDGVSHSLECHAEHAAAIAGGTFVQDVQPVQQPGAEPVAYKVRHPKNPKCSYVATEPPEPNRIDTGEPDEYFGGEVTPLYAQAAPALPQQGLVQHTKESLLDLAMGNGAILTGKPDGSEAITVLFNIVAWQKFSAAVAQAPVEMLFPSKKINVHLPDGDSRTARVVFTDHKEDGATDVCVVVEDTNLVRTVVDVPLLEAEKAWFDGPAMKEGRGFRARMREVAEVFASAWGIKLPPEG